MTENVYTRHSKYDKMGYKPALPPPEEKAGEGFLTTLFPVLPYLLSIHYILKTDDFQTIRSV